MEGRTLLRCADCGRTREISGEMPEEYARSFGRYVRDDGWVPRPGPTLALICGICAAGYAGHETVDDEAKIHGG
jgi:hypothetical protein